MMIGNRLQSEHKTISAALSETKGKLENEYTSISTSTASSESISKEIDKTIIDLEKAQMRLQSALLRGRETAKEMRTIKELANEELVAAIEGARQQAQDDAALDDRAIMLQRYE